MDGSVDGNWFNAANWVDGAGNPPSAPPEINNDVVIPAGTPPCEIPGGPGEASAECRNLTVEGTLNVAIIGSSVLVSGDGNFTGTVTGAGLLLFSSSGSIGGTSFLPKAIVQGNPTTVNGVSFGDLDILGSGGARMTSANPVCVTGDLTIGTGSQADCTIELKGADSLLEGTVEELKVLKNPGATVTAPNGANVLTDLVVQSGTFTAPNAANVDVGGQFNVQSTATVDEGSYNVSGDATVPGLPNATLKMEGTSFATLNANGTIQQGIFAKEGQSLVVIQGNVVFFGARVESGRVDVDPNATVSICDDLNVAEGTTLIVPTNVFVSFKQNGTINGIVDGELKSTSSSTGLVQTGPAAFVKTLTVEKAGTGRCRLESLAAKNLQMVSGQCEVLTAHVVTADDVTMTSGLLFGGGTLLCNGGLAISGGELNVSTVGLTNGSATVSGTAVVNKNSTLKTNGASTISASEPLGGLDVESGTTTAQSDIQTKDELKVQSGATYDLDNHTHEANDDVTNDGDIVDGEVKVAAANFFVAKLQGQGQWPDITVESTTPTGGVTFNSDTQCQKLQVNSGSANAFGGSQISCTLFNLFGNRCLGAGAFLCSGNVEIGANSEVRDCTIQCDGTYTTAGTSSYTGNARVVCNGQIFNANGAIFQFLEFIGAHTTAITGSLTAKRGLAVAAGNLAVLSGNSSLTCEGDSHNDGEIQGDCHFNGTTLTCNYSGNGRYGRCFFNKAAGLGRILGVFVAQRWIQIIGILRIEIQARLKVEVETILQNGSWRGSGIAECGGAFFKVESNFDMAGNDTPDVECTAAVCELSSAFAPLQQLTRFAGTTAQTVMTNGANFSNVRTSNPAGTTFQGRVQTTGDVEAQQPTTAPDGVEVGGDTKVAPGGSLDTGSADNEHGGNVDVQGQVTSTGDNELTGSGNVRNTSGTPLNFSANNAGPFTFESQPMGTLSLFQSVGHLVSGAVVNVQSLFVEGGRLSAFGEGGEMSVAGDATINGTVTGSLTYKVGGIATVGGTVNTLVTESSSDGTPLPIVSLTDTLRINRLTINDHRVFNGATILRTEGVIIGPAGRVDISQNMDWTTPGGFFGPNYDVFGTLSIAGGATLGLTGLLDIKTSGSLELLGTPSAPVSLVPSPASGFGWFFDLRGHVRAANFVIRRPRQNGVNVLPTATFAPPPLDFRGGVLIDPDARLMTWDHPIPRSFHRLTFEDPTPGGQNNVRVLNPAAGTITLVNAGGNLAGPPFEDDPHGRIEWVDDRTAVSAFTVLGAVESATLNWVTTNESPDLVQFVVERAPSPSGPFALVAELSPLGPSTYQVTDGPLPAGTYTYRLSERLVHDATEELDSGTATVTTIVPPNVLTVGPNGFLADVPTALAQATGTDVLIRILAGSYPSFTLSAAQVGGRLRLLGEAGVVFDTTTGPVTLDQIGPGTVVELKDLEIGDGLTGGVALDVDGCTGLILLDAVTVRGGPGAVGANVRASSQVVMQRSTLSGNEALDVGLGSTVDVGGGALSGLSVSGASLVNLVGVSPTQTVEPGSTVTSLAGALPEISVPHFVEPGTNLVTGIDAPPGSAWLAFVALGNTRTPFPGTEWVVLIDIPSAILYATGATNAAGQSTSLFFLPPEAALLAGTALTVQALTSDAQNVLRLTNADSFVVAQ